MPQSGQIHKLCSPLDPYNTVLLVPACAAAFAPHLMLGEVMTAIESKATGFARSASWETHALTCGNPKPHSLGLVHLKPAPAVVRWQGQCNALRHGGVQICTSWLCMAMIHALERDQRY